jgi:hypothetical protein
VKALHAVLRKQKVEVDLERQRLHALQQRRTDADRACS